VLDTCSDSEFRFLQVSAEETGSAGTRERGEEDIMERKITVVCAFSTTSPRITAHDIHEWIFDEIKIPEQKLNAIQIDGTKRHI
jgi:hypothetical protein